MPKEIAKKPPSLAGTWKILETQSFGGNPNKSGAYWTMDEKGNSWFHSTEQPPVNAKPSDVNVADLAKREMNYRSPNAVNDEYSMYGIFAFEDDVLVINYDTGKRGRENRPKGLELETGGTRWKFKKNAEFGK